MKNKYSVTSIKDREGNITHQYAGLNNLTGYQPGQSQEITGEIESFHRKFFEMNPNRKRLTTKVLECIK